MPKALHLKHLLLTYILIKNNYRNLEKVKQKPADKAPIINWPSAPIFQILALKQNINPEAIIMRGQALTITSAILSALEKGDRKT